MWYKAEYETSEMELITADNDSEALEKAWEQEEEFGCLFNLSLLDDNDNIIKTII